MRDFILKLTIDIMASVVILLLTVSGAGAILHYYKTTFFVGIYLKPDALPAVDKD